MADISKVDLNPEFYGSDPENAEASQAAEDALRTDNPWMDYWDETDDRAISLGNS